MDIKRTWQTRWFQLYGNHLVYWKGAMEDVDMAKGRGVLHLTPQVCSTCLMCTVYVASTLSLLRSIS
jgi:hypothetical protein